jgi:outer membrane protein OmpA-like peptidoglycan-associated protein
LTSTAQLTVAAACTLALAAIDLAWLNVVLAPAVLDGGDRGDPPSFARVAQAEGELETGPRQASPPPAPAPAAADPVEGAVAVAEPDAGGEGIEEIADLESATATRCEGDDPALFRRVYFERGSAALSPEATERIDALAAVAVAEAPASFIVEGHADSRGSERLNDELSRERAVAVADRARAAGVPGSILMVRHFGERSLIAPETPDSRWRNRRVVLCLSNGSASR